MQLGELIQTERKELKMSQDELASRLMRSQDWMSLVERNKLDPLQEDLENIAKELKSPLLQDIADGRAFRSFKKRLWGERMVTLKINNDNGGHYTSLGAVIQLAEIINASDDVDIVVEYKKRGQAVESSSSIKNPAID